MHAWQIASGKFSQQQAGRGRHRQHLGSIPLFFAAAKLFDTMLKGLIDADAVVLLEQ
jgi:hypothetical protein